MITREHFELGETAVTIVAEAALVHFAKEVIFEVRRELQSYIAEDPFFQLTFEPYQAPSDAPPIVRRMCQAGTVAGVGPMAAVAGAVAEAAVRALVEHGAEHAIVDNGGDIAMLLSEETAVGIYAGHSLFRGYAYLLPPTDGIYGVCTSSGTVGPSISLGKADAATIFAKDVALADACATALGNLVVDEEEGTLGEAVERVGRFPGVDGCVVMMGSHMAIRGRVPEMVRCTDPMCKVSERLF